MQATLVSPDFCTSKPRPPPPPPPPLPSPPSNISLLSLAIFAFTSPRWPSVALFFCVLAYSACVMSVCDTCAATQLSECLRRQRLALKQGLAAYTKQGNAFELRPSQQRSTEQFGVCTAAANRIGFRCLPLILRASSC
jgi:hypothetical protein